MITRDLIKALSSSKTYFKGFDIYRSGWMIEDFSVDKEENKHDIRGVVAGSYDNEYQVEIEYDDANDQVGEVYCDCPAFSSYEGLCKHCVAVLLEYEEYLNRQIIIEEHRKNNPKTKLVPEDRGRQTTWEIRQILDRRMTAMTAPIRYKELYGKVELEPLLLCDEKDVTAEFKIGSGQMYVLKDIFEFAERMRKQELYSYGKKLQMVHNMEMFSEESRKIAEYITEWAERNGKYYQQTQYYPGYGYGTTHQKLRGIPMDGRELEAFLSIFPKSQIMVCKGEKRSQLYQIIEESPRQTMKITGVMNGIEITADLAFCYGGKQYTIYAQDGVLYKAPNKQAPVTEEFLRSMEKAPGRTVFIRKEDLPMFCREILPELKKRFVCLSDNFDEEDFDISQAEFEIYLDAPQKDFITCRVMAVYGDDKYNIYDRETKKNARDMVAEIGMEQIISPYFNAFNPNTLELVAAESEDMLYELLSDGIPAMQELTEVFVSESLRGMQVRTVPKIQVGVSLSGDLLSLKLVSENMSQDALLEILSKYNKKKKYYRLKSGEFIDLDDEGIEVLYELREALQLQDEELQKGNVLLPRFRAVYLDEALKEKQALPVAKNKEFKALVRNMRTVEDNDFEVPESLDKILREYQKKGFLWIKTLRNNGFGGILADDMGLGKTLQVITFLLSEFEEAGAGENRRSLIVTPASLVYNWQNEIEKFAPSLDTVIIAGSAGQRKEQIAHAGEREILITSYELLKRDVEYYQGISFYCQIIDEAQYIKNHNTKAARAVKAVPAGFRLALTGTPMENRLSELWSIFDYLMPGFLYSYQTFRSELEVPIVQKQDEAAVERLQKMLRPFIMRRLKKDVLKDLPDKLEKHMYARFEGEQEKLYDAHVKRLMTILDKQSEEEFKTSKIQILSELTKLRQLCCHPGLLYEDYKDDSAKTDMCMELIENAVSGGHKILLFSQFTSMLAVIQERLQQAGISFYTLTGATGKKMRSHLVKAFEEDETSVFCISLKAGGTGLNLTAADIVIHYDPWWNLAVQNQATDRAHRIGQKNVVTVYKLIVKGTIEENIVKLQERKRELTEQVLEGAGLSEGSFSREELIELLKAH